nr:MAG TPA: hypothetical protein [Caudoviricetes sp.]
MICVLNRVNFPNPLFFGTCRGKALIDFKLLNIYIYTTPFLENMLV